MFCHGGGEVLEKTTAKHNEVTALKVAQKMCQPASHKEDPSGDKKTRSKRGNRTHNSPRQVVELLTELYTAANKGKKVSKMQTRGPKSFPMHQFGFIKIECSKKLFKVKIS